MALEREKQTYRDKLAELEQFQGKFVLIHGEDVVDVFDTYSDALSRGYKDFGTEPFLVKRIETGEQVHLVTRFLDPMTSASGT